MRRRAQVVVVGVVGLALGSLRPAHGDWPVGRHDARRTGAASGTSDITAPEVMWRHYLGGALTSQGARAFDVDGAGVEEYVMAAGGALVARRFDDTIVWSVPPRDIQSVLAITDLDGDADAEIVVGAARSVLVIDARTGAIEWESPPDTMTMFGAARIGDLDGDGLDDVVAVDCGPCCAVPGTWPGAAFSFADGASQPRVLWEVPSVTCGNGLSLTLFDADGDGGLEVLVGTATAFQLLDGATGAELGRTADVGTSMQISQCTPLEVDGQPGQELACVHNNAAFTSERSLFVIDWDEPALSVVWRTPFSGQPTAELRTIDVGVDLGAGPVLVAAARDDASQPWTTYVLDAATGNERDTLVGHRVVGTAPRAAGGRYLLTTDDAGLHGWRDPGGTLVPTWTRPGDEEPVLVTDAVASRSSAIGLRAAILPRSGEIVVTNRSQTDVLRALALDDTTATASSELLLPFSVRIAAVFVTADMTPRPIAVARTDGFLIPLDEELVPRLGVDDVQAGGMRTGGYYASGTFRGLQGPPRSADLDDDGRDEIVVGDARGALLRLDPEDAALAAPPRLTWEVANASAPALTTARDDTGAVLCIERDPTAVVPSYSVALRDADTNLRWRAALPGPPVTDLIPAQLDGDELPDVVLQWGASGDALLRTRALAGSDGALLWEDVIEPGAGRTPAGMAAGAWPGQSADTVVHVGASRVWVLSGATGLTVAQSAAIGIYYFLPMLVELDGDPATEVALTGGFSPIHVLNDELAAVWSSPDTEQRPYPYGSIAACPDGTKVLVSQSWGDPARLKLTTVSSTGFGAERTLWLAGGEAYPTATALATSGTWAGQLTSSTVHADLSGQGRPSALVGSSDGHLYLVDPCAGELDAAVAFAGAVGEAVYADTDGDGRDEILVTVSDGYLHALQNHAIDAPAQVLDLDLDGASTDDVDVMPVDGRLAARWDAVAGARSYEVAVVDAFGAFVTSPAWRDVDDTEVVLDDIPLARNDRFRVLVRAIGATGHSIDTASDGVQVNDEGDDDPRADGCCGTTGSPLTATLGAILVALALRVRRWNRRRW